MRRRMVIFGAINEMGVLLYERKSMAFFGVMAFISRILHSSSRLKDVWSMEGL